MGKLIQTSMQPLCRQRLMTQHETYTICWPSKDLIVDNNNYTFMNLNLIPKVGIQGSCMHGNFIDANYYCTYNVHDMIMYCTVFLPLSSV